ncbi:MAG TPA: condensation domain-containing protein, partial [Vicinamibacterales bacterium]|nr:condensation domain-containing protein [Vicinamibacterales bacterium]
MASEQVIEPRAAALSPAKRVLLQARLNGLHRTAPIARHEPRDQAPTSFAQERLWFLDRVGHGGAAYNLAVPLRISGALDVRALECALGNIVERHGALRTIFREIDGVPVQIIQPFNGFMLRQIDVSALAESEREAEARRFAIEDGTRPFDLSAGPLMRATLLRLALEEHLLLLCMHHIVSDGWSMGVFFRELWAGYDAYRVGGAPQLPELSLQYEDFAVWQRSQLQGKLLERHLDYWKDRLAGAPELLALPTDRPRLRVASFRGSAVPVVVPAGLLDQLRGLARREGATLYMVVLAAFQVLLARYCGSDDVVVGTLVAGRGRSELQPLIGLFMNTLVLRSDLSGDPTVREAIARARETVLGAYEHQDLPFEQVVAEIRPERNQSYSTLFQALFQLETEERRGSVHDGLHIRGVHLPRQSAKFDLTLDLAAHANGIGGVLEYSTDLFDNDTARRMVVHLTRVLEQMVADPLRRLSAIDLLTTAERTEVVETWNQTAVPVAPQCVHEL